MLVLKAGLECSHSSPGQLRYTVNQPWLEVKHRIRKLLLSMTPSLFRKNVSFWNSALQRRGAISWAYMSIHNVFSTRVLIYDISVTNQWWWENICKWRTKHNNYPNCLYYLWRACFHLQTKPEFRWVKDQVLNLKSKLCFSVTRFEDLIQTNQHLNQTLQNKLP